MLERGALSEAKVVELSAKFVCVKLNPKDAGDVAKMMGVSRLPDVRLISAKGEELKAFRGGVSAEELVKAMESAVGAK